MKKPDWLRIRIFLGLKVKEIWDKIFIPLVMIGCIVAAIAISAVATYYLFSPRNTYEHVMFTSAGLALLLILGAIIIWLKGKKDDFMWWLRSNWRRAGEIADSKRKDNEPDKTGN